MTTQNMKTTRNPSLDLISGVMILWMVIYHILQYSNLTGSKLYQMPLQWLFFFMPWFYFKSGMHFKAVIDESIAEHLKKLFVRLFMPLIVWTGVGYMLTIPLLPLDAKEPLWEIVVHPVSSLMISGDTLGNAPLWFLFSLFIVRLLAYYLAQVRSKFLLLALLFLGGFLLEKKSIILPLGASTIPLGLSFFLLGHWYSKNPFAIKNKALLACLIVTFILLNSYQWNYVDIHRNESQHGSYLSYLPMSLLAIGLSIHFSSTVKSDFLSWAGKNSMSFLVLHWPLLSVITICYRFFQFETMGYSFALALTVISLPLLVIAAYFMPKNTINSGN